MSFEGISLKARNIKCFGEQPFGFNQIKPINIAIGRNSSGKSTLLDLVQFALDRTSIQLSGHLGREPQAIVEVPFSNDLKDHLPNDQVLVRQDERHSVNINLRRWAFTYFPENPIVCEISKDENIRAVGIAGYTPDSNDPRSEPVLQRILAIHQRKIPNPFEGFSFRRIAADRDIVPEPDANNMAIGANGSGVTSVIRRFLTRHDLDRDLVEIEFRDALNTILRPDTDFARVGIRDLGDGPNSRWEIYLDELKKARSIPLSHTGSGLKTVMLVLCNLLIIP